MPATLHLSGLTCHMPLGLLELLSLVRVSCRCSVSSGHATSRHFGITPLPPRPPDRRRTERFAARASGLASGLALAVRPAGSAEAPGSTARRRRVARSAMRSTVDAGGADPDNARRSGPVTSARRPAHLARAWRPRPARETPHRGRDGGERLRPVPGQPCAAAAAPVGLPPGRARAKLPPRNGEAPATLARLHPVIPAALLTPSVACG